MLKRTLHKNGIDLPGVTSPYLYFGMWRAMFACVVSFIRKTKKMFI
jgi:hypothetical protein